MKHLTLEPYGKTVAVPTEERVLNAILSEQSECSMACGGKGLCATCHIWVEEGGEHLTPITEREQRTLGMLTGANEKSRLACQAKVLADGVRVTLPDGMFIESVGDLEELIGRRAKQNILHPIDMRVLVNQGKIITRSRIMQLSDLDVDMAKIKSDAAKL